LIELTQHVVHYPTDLRQARQDRAHETVSQLQRPGLSPSASSAFLIVSRAVAYRPCRCVQLLVANTSAAPLGRRPVASPGLTKTSTLFFHTPTWSPTNQTPNQRCPSLVRSPLNLRIVRPPPHLPPKRNASPFPRPPVVSCSRLNTHPPVATPQSRPSDARRYLNLFASSSTVSVLARRTCHHAHLRLDHLLLR
jgi:hypothetical protein